MARLFSIVLTFLIVISSSFTQAGRDEYKIRTIVIDAGHGGHDSGCLGSSSKEKHIALSVALKLGKLIQQKYPDVKVIYTRKTDVFVPLHERAGIANKAKADLFICIHCNSGNKSAFGVETYVMGLHKTEDNLSVAKRENAAILLEDDYKTQYEGFDPNSPEANIIFNLYQNQFLNQSLMFASNIQKEIVEYSGRHNRGVRQAGFLVLYKTAMPAVLIETGFLTNQTEEKYLNTDKGQHEMATCIFRAFSEYKIDNETPGSFSSKPVEINVIPDEQNDSLKNSAAEIVKKENTPLPMVNKGNENILKEKDVPVSESGNTPTVIADTIKKEIAKVETKEKTVPPPPTINPVNIYYTVQVGASLNPAKDDSKFENVEGMFNKKGSDNYTRYHVGKFTTLEAAKRKQTELKAMGFPDCFLVGYNGHKKVAVAEVTELLKKK